MDIGIFKHVFWSQVITNLYIIIEDQVRSAIFGK